MKTQRLAEARQCPREVHAHLFKHRYAVAMLVVILQEICRGQARQPCPNNGDLLGWGGVRHDQGTNSFDSLILPAG